MNEQDPLGLYYPNIVEISDVSSPGGGSALRDPAVGTALTTGRTVWPGERVSLRCRLPIGTAGMCTGGRPSTTVPGRAP
jgi:hypothetical protein